MHKIERIAIIFKMANLDTQVFELTLREALLKKI